MKVFISGGAGFIGCNAAKFFMDRGDTVVVFDNLFRRGSGVNLRWLRNQGDFIFIEGDLRDYQETSRAIKEHSDVELVLHFAAQVAVTFSVAHPREDFEINALGTFNLLEAVRHFAPQATFLYSSTNKVYGGMEGVRVRLEGKGNRYVYEEYPGGIDENRPLDFHSPYGCSKGCADQYVRDYARIYGLNTIVFRQSCIYGPHQFGVEDQGWIAWFAIAAVLGRPITIYGDGKQVRDVLYVEDLVEACLQATANIKSTRGKIYNIGGGPENAVSLLEVIEYLEELERGGKGVLTGNISFSDWRPGDQKTFICNISLAQKDFGWAPRTKYKEGIKKLYRWVGENKSLIEEVLKNAP